MERPPIDITGIGGLPVLLAPTARPAVRLRRRLTPRQLKAAVNRLNRARGQGTLILVLLFALCLRGDLSLADSVNPITNGAVYGKADAATAAANDTAIATSIAQIAKTGGGDLVITGSLAFTQTISPPTITFNGTPNYPLDFGIAGANAAAELFDVDGGVAISFPLPVFPANLPGDDLRQYVRDLGIRGGGISIRGGGKYIALRRINIYAVTNCPTALQVASYDGGHLDEVNIHECPNSTGFAITAAHQTHVDITSRTNAAGGAVTDSVLNGSLYCEANAGLGLRANDLLWSDLALWLEGNAGGQAQLTNCRFNIFTGKVCAEDNSLGADLLSANLNHFASTPLSVRPTGQSISTAQPAASTFGTFVTLSAGACVIHQDTFLPANATAASGAPNWIELRPAGQANCGGSWQAGDCLVATVTVTPDAAAAAFYGTQQIFFSASAAAGVAPAGMSQAWSPAGTMNRAVLVGNCLAAGSGLRLFMFPQAGTSGPPGDITLTVTADVRRLTTP